MVVLQDSLKGIGANIICYLWLSFSIQLLVINPGIDLAIMLCEYIKLYSYCMRGITSYELADGFLFLVQFVLALLLI